MDQHPTGKNRIGALHLPPALKGLPRLIKRNAAQLSTLAPNSLHEIAMSVDRLQHQCGGIVKQLPKAVEIVKTPLMG